MRATIALLICVMGSPRFLPAETCEVPTVYREILLHHLAWTHKWWNVRYLDQPEVHMYMTKSSTQVIWYEAISQTTFTQSLTGSENDLRAVACKLTPLECIKMQLGNPVRQQTVPERLIGIAPPTKDSRLREEDILECTVPIDRVQPWDPSPDSPQKEVVIDRISTEVQKQAGYAGRMLSAFCNDFNVADPGVYAVADVIRADGSKERLVISMTLNSRNGGSASTWRVDDAVDVPQIVSKIILNDPLKIDPADGK